MDARADVVVHARLDGFLTALAESLDIKVPPYTLEMDTLSPRVTPLSAKEKALYGVGDGDEVEKCGGGGGGGGGWYGRGLKITPNKKRRRRRSSTSLEETNIKPLAAVARVSEKL